MRLIDSLSVRLWSIVLASQHKTIIPPHFLRSISNMDDISKYYGLQWEGLSRRCEPGKGSAAAACIVEQMESGPSDHCATPRLPSLPRQIRYAYYCFPNILQGAGGKNLFTHIQCWIFKFMPCTKYLLSLWFDDNKFGSDQLSDFEPIVANPVEVLLETRREERKLLEAIEILWLPIAKRLIAYEFFCAFGNSRWIWT